MTDTAQAMAFDLAQAAAHIVNQLDGISTQVKNQAEAAGSQAVGLNIQKFDGTKASEFKSWISAIEKHAFLYNCDDNKRKLVAYQSSSGAVSDYIRRFLETRNKDTFNDLKKELSQRFSDVSDKAQAFSMLGKTRQRPGEGVQIYAERLLDLARRAYDNVQDGGAAIIDRQLIEFFTDGLIDNSIKLKLLRDIPMTFERAVKIAMDEQSLRARFAMRMGKTGQHKTNMNYNDIPVEMEVDHVRPKQNCFRCGGRHLARDCRTRNLQTDGRNRHVHAVNRQRDRDDNPVCWNCGLTGHLWRHCKSPQGQGQQRYQTKGYRYQTPGPRDQTQGHQYSTQGQGSRESGQNYEQGNGQTQTAKR